MVYCSRCGTKNDDDAKFCKKCGAMMGGPPRFHDKEWEDRCDEECSGKHKTPLWTSFWIIILILVAIGIIFSLFSRLFHMSMPGMMGGIDYWDIFWLLVGLVIISFILYAITTSRRHHR